MSRCFPYPPPGFEPKLTNDHVDLLQKEKHKDKKHKKDKKDRKESKEKREKEKHHGKEKHRDSDKDKEKKERKEKHKHKKKEKERDKESDNKDKHRIQSVPSQAPTDKALENPKIHSEHCRRPDEVPQAGPGSQSIERRFAGTSNHGASEKRPVPVQQSVPSVHKKSNEATKAGPNTNHSTNHRPAVGSERRVLTAPSTSSPEEGMLAKRTVSTASNPTLANPNNSLPQRKSNGPNKQVANANHHGTVNTERRVMGNEAKKPVPSPLNSLQGKSNGPSNQSTNHHQQQPVTNSVQNRVAASERSDEAKRAAGNSVAQQMQRKTDGPTFQVTNNHQVIGVNEKNRDNGGSGKQEEGGKREKRKDRDERKREKEQRRIEKRQRKEREREEREKRKERERERVKEVGGSVVRPSNEGPQRNVEKLGAAADGSLSKKRKEGPSNGFLHEGELRAQKLVRTSPPENLIKKDASSNGFVHENDVGSTKLTIRLPPPHPSPVVENGRTTAAAADHPPPLLSPPITLASSSSSPQIPPAAASNNNNNTVKKAEVYPPIKKAPYLNGTVPDAKVLKKRREEPPPHPDLKYLNVVYSVPKLEEKDLLPPCDDQEWLLGTKPNPNPNPNPNCKVPEYGLNQQGSGEVWDRAVLLDSADASFALPYVVPF